jgi:hypothetical protein
MMSHIKLRIERDLSVDLWCVLAFENNVSIGWVVHFVIDDLKIITNVH